jgi:hypothetical protein
MRFLGIVKSEKPAKKYDAHFQMDNGRTKVVSFGAAGMQDYTMHHDAERQRRYLARHKANEHWNNPVSAGALSRYILWSSPSLTQGIHNYRSHFHL